MRVEEDVVGEEREEVRGEREDEAVTEMKPEWAKDTLYSWLVLGVAFITFTIQLGFITSFGLYADILANEWKTTEDEATFAGGLTEGVMSCVTLVGAGMFRMLGSRSCLLLGATWSVLGFLTASQAQSIPQLYAANFIIGLGFSFNLVAAASSVVAFFDKYRDFALSFMSVGAAVGTTLMPPILRSIIANQGWRSSFLVLSGVCGFFFVATAILYSCSTPDFMTPLHQVFQLSLLKRKTFLVFCFACVIWGGSSYTFFFLITGYIHHIKLEESTSVLILSVLGLVNIVGRVVSSILVHQSWNNKLVLNTVSCMIWSAAALCFQWAKSETELVVVGAVFGIGFGGMYPTLAPLLMELVGEEAFPDAFSMHGFCNLGIGSLLISWLTGFVVEHGSYEKAYTFLGVTGLMGAVATTVLAIARGLRFPVAAVDAVELEGVAQARERRPSTASAQSTFSTPESLHASHVPYTMTP